MIHLEVKTEKISRAKGCGWLTSVDTKKANSKSWKNLNRNRFVVGCRSSHSKHSSEILARMLLKFHLTKLGTSKFVQTKSWLRPLHAGAKHVSNWKKVKIA